MPDARTCHVRVAPTDVEAHLLDMWRDALPAWRRARCDRLRRPQDQAACVVAFQLLTDLWSDVHGSALPTIAEQPSGQLVLPAFTGWHLSLSHRDGWAACALAPVAVGLDLTGPVRQANFLEHIANPTEFARYRDDDDLAVLWTRKEALAKRTGEGLGRDIARWDTTSHLVRTWIRNTPPLTLSVACEVDVIVPSDWTELT